MKGLDSTNCIHKYIVWDTTDVSVFWDTDRTIFQISYNIKNVISVSVKSAHICHLPAVSVRWLSFMFPQYETISPWWRHQMETFPALLALCAGNSPVTGEFPHKDQWRGALIISLIFAGINGWVNNRGAGDSSRHRAHYDITVVPRRFPGCKQPNSESMLLWLARCWADVPHRLAGASLFWRMGLGLMGSRLATAVSGKMCPRDLEGLDSKPRFAHNWNLRCCQCMETCSLFDAKQYHNSVCDSSTHSNTFTFRNSVIFRVNRLEVIFGYKIISSSFYSTLL